ncbi:MAG: hypothetical protein AAGH15_02425 [Myxococcota bacterium]
MKPPERFALRPTQGLGKRLERRRLVYMALVTLAGVVGVTTLPQGLACPIGIVMLLGMVASLAVFRAHVRIGDDGVGMRGDGFPSFVAWRDVRELRSVAHGVELVMREGSTQLLPERHPHRLLAQLRPRWTRFHEQPVVEVPSSLLEEAPARPGYRAPAPPPVATLLEVAGDPRVPLEVRLRAIDRALAQRRSAAAEVRVLAAQHVDEEVAETIRARLKQA